MKKHLLKILSVAFILSAITLQNSFAQTEVKYSGFVVDTLWNGAGTTASPYQISTAEELAGLAYMVNSRHHTYLDTCFAMTTIIELNSETDISNWESWNTTGGTTPAHNWQPIGTSAHAFSGTFDGEGYTVNGLYINRRLTTAGLFGYATGTIKNLGVLYSSISCSGDAPYIGSIVGQLNGTISNCFNWGTVKNTGTSIESGCNPSAGGVVGYLYGTILNCYNRGNVSCTGKKFVWVGGVAGRTQKVSSDLENCYNTGTVVATLEADITDATKCGPRAGGIVGSNYSTIKNCYNTGSVSYINNNSFATELYVGQIVGQINDGSISTCYALNGTQCLGNRVSGTVTDTIYISGADDSDITVGSATYTSLCDALNAFMTDDETLRVWGSNSYINGGYPTFVTDDANSTGSAGASAGYLINNHLMYIRGTGDVNSDAWSALKEDVYSVLIGDQITSIAEDMLTGLGDGAHQINIVCDNANCLFVNAPSSNYTYFGGIQLTETGDSYSATASSVSITDGFPLETPASGFTAESVTYTGRTFPAENGYGTVILPFTPTTTTGLTFYTLGNVGENAISFTAVLAPAANTPYLFKTGSETVSVTGTGTGAGDEVTVKTSPLDGETIDNWTMKGEYLTTTFQNVSSDTTRYYFDATSSLIRPLSDGYTLTVNPFRCYFDAPYLSASSARTFDARFGDEDATSIESLIEKTPLVIFGERGSITLKCNAAMPVNVYSVNGAQVAKEQLSAGEEKSLSLPAGIYMVNGTKVLVK